MVRKGEILNVEFLILNTCVMVVCTCSLSFPSFGLSRLKRLSMLIRLPHPCLFKIKNSKLKIPAPKAI